MSVPNDYPTYVHKLTHIKSVLSNKEGALESLKEREDFITSKVAKAKGRLSLKGEVETFLEEIQNEIHQKAVGNYEKLLTAIANDVLDGSNIVGLNLYTERGLPALDIYLETLDGNKEDIIEGAGGSMTNVMSLGLRMIATVKSGERRFVALDEPDCWISPKRVKKFYGIISELSQKLSLQSLVISHHSVELLPEDFFIVEIKKEEDGIVKVINNPAAYHWQIDEVGIRSIHLKNFMSHKDSKINLNPGVTSIIGENNLGKSVFLRGLRAVAYGECSDTDIMHEEKKLEVALEVENERIIRFTRQMNRNPRNIWTLEDKSGNILLNKDENTEYKTGGRNVPEWVQKLLRINKISGFDNQLSHQKFPVFLLGEGPSKRASVLSIGKESGYIQDMIVKHKEKNKEDSIIISEGEEEVYMIQEKTKSLQALKSLKENLQEVSDLKDKIGNAYNKIEDINKIQEKMHSIQTSIINKTKVYNLLETYNENKIDKLKNRLSEQEEVKNYGEDIRRITQKIESKKSTLEKLAVLPKVPMLADVENIAKEEEKVKSLRDKIQKAIEEQSSLEKVLSEVSVSIKEVLEANGNMCPTCGQGIDNISQVIEGDHYG